MHSLVQICVRETMFAIYALLWNESNLPVQLAALALNMLCMLLVFAVVKYSKCAIYSHLCETLQKRGALLLKLEYPIKKCHVTSTDSQKLIFF